MAGHRNVTLGTAWALAVAAHLSWGYLAPGGKLLLEWWPEWTLNAARMGLGTVVLMLWFGREETVYGLKAILVDRNLPLLGVAGIGLTFGLYVISLGHIEATAAAVLIFLAPFFTAGIARFAIGERTGPHLFLAAAGALVGAYLALFGTDLGAFGRIDAATGLGLLLNLASVVMWAVYTVHLRVVAPRYPLGRLTIATFTVATLFFALMALVTEWGDVEPARAFAPRPLMHLALFVAFPTVAAYLLYSASIERVGAGPITILLGVELIAAAILAHLLLGERFPPVRLVGLAVTALAVVGFVWRQTVVERKRTAMAAGRTG